ncbi:hypothetical protein CBR_g52668 [Chara braunii]|uniref:Uncharacterized protein n=1 Tax=Chara braunii TaxID=69332 RepID=A0A388MAN5_CHABU|nr:hypothetical protein CBR_g52668 [Chara braunii]|eukprot:GBG91634.1 hypothetical protein CBR_g52668 [Chara braunii]
MYGPGLCHFYRLPGHFIRDCPFRNNPNGAEMEASIQGAMTNGGQNGNHGLLPAPSSSSQAAGTSAVSNAIVPYQAPQNRGGGGGGYYGGYGNNNYRSNQGSGGHWYAKPWGGGYRDANNDERFDRIYELLAEQAEEREKRKQEEIKLELLEAEKNKLQEEDERNAQTKKEKEQHEARLGKIVRNSMKAICESVLGKKVDLPDEEESQVGKLRRELEELKARCAGEKAESSLDVLHREKEALQKAQVLSSEEEALRKEIEGLKARIVKGKFVDISSGSSQSDEIAALRLQIQELEEVRLALQSRSSELSSLKAENSSLKKDFLDLKSEMADLKNASNKRTSEVVIEKSPPVEPEKGKQRMVPIGDAVYTPRDLEALQKAYKKALAGEEPANKETIFLKERMAWLGAQVLTKQRSSVRRPSWRKTTPRNLRPALSAVQIEDDESNKEDHQKTKAMGDLAENAEDEQLQKLQEKERRVLRPLKKGDMVKLCDDEGITYIKLDQSKADVAKIRTRRRFAEWLKDQGVQDDEEDQQYATSTEEVNEE